MAERKQVLVLGTSFAGFTAAIDLKRHLGDAHDVVVVAPSPQFVFIPSLIWVPFGIRDEADISFDVRPVYEKRRIAFVQARAQSIDLEGHKGSCASSRAP